MCAAETAVAPLEPEAFRRQTDVSRETLDRLKVYLELLVKWQKAINLVGKARLEGTQRPSYILDLIDYGEETADYEYSPRYVKDQSG